MMLPAVLLSGCTPALLVPDDREQVCEVRVDETFGSPVFHPNGKQEYWITVDWKVTTATGSRVLAETTTRCSQKSSRGVDEWFAVPETGSRSSASWARS